MGNGEFNGPTHLWNLLKINTLLVYLALLFYLAPESIVCRTWEQGFSRISQYVYNWVKNQLPFLFFNKSWCLWPRDLLVAKPSCIPYTTIFKVLSWLLHFICISFWPICLSQLLSLGRGYYLLKVTSQSFQTCSSLLATPQ